MNGEQITLAKRVLEHVTMYPEQHDQSLFFSHCGTVGCIAGWTVKLAGGDPNELLRDGLGVGFRAERLLGLSHSQAIELFYNANRDADARELLAHYIAEAEAALP